MTDNQINNKKEKLQDLQNEILKCRICKQKFGFEPKPYVWGEQNAKILQISQAPSFNVHKTGIPFNDASGKILIEEWYQIPKEIFYNKRNFYITSVSHCYPGKTSSGNSRVPPVICAKKFLFKEIQLIDNELFIIIGSKAASLFFEGRNFTELIFDKNLQYNNKKAIVLPHPSPLNFRWFKNHKNFFTEVLPYVRSEINRILSQSKE